MPRPNVSNDQALVVRTQRKRGSTRRKATSTQRSVEQFAGDAYSLARRAISGLDQVRKFINIETKVLDFDVATQAISTTPTVTYASGIAQGTDVIGRVGDSIKCQSLNFIGRVVINSAATFSCVRVLLFRDMENQGAAPAATEVLETVSGSVTTRSPLNYLNHSRFSVLYDDYITLDVATAYSQPVRASVPMIRHIKYRGTGATVSSAAEGSIFWLFVSDEVTNTPNISVYTQYTFTDD